MQHDIWHFPRQKLAQQVLGMFDSGLSNALIFFAPRRMGKTEFLRKDMLPLAESEGWCVLYFSFLDAANSAQKEFTEALHIFAKEIVSAPKARKFLQRISKLSGQAAGVKAEIELRASEQEKQNMKELISYLAAHKKVLLLLDEVQMLAKSSRNTQFVAGLRTALDTNKDNVKVIFTGSSREGLRQMFSQASAPFFHFGQNLPFPELGREFTDHLANVFKQVTGREINKDVIWAAFQEMEKVPQLIRSLVERLALNPDLSIEDAKRQLLSSVYDARGFAGIWKECSLLEKLLLKVIAEDGVKIFSAKTRAQLADEMGLKEVSPSTVQSAIRVLMRRDVVGQLVEQKGYFIEDPNFRCWLLQAEL